MRSFIGGVIVTLACLTGAGYAYFARGFAPVATSAPEMPFERKLAHMALNARIEKEMPKTVPVEANETNYLAGAHIYVEHCAVCHNLPGQKPSAIALGEFPKPPELLAGTGVSDDPPGETYWKTANGIRLTGMPGFEKSLSPTQMWQVSLLLANADKVPESVKAVLARASDASPPTAPK